MSEDPIGFKGGDANLYRYVRNRPIFSIDPRGLADPIDGTPGSGWYSIPESTPGGLSENEDPEPSEIAENLMGAALLGHWMHRAAIYYTSTGRLTRASGLSHLRAVLKQKIATAAFDQSTIQPGSDVFFSMEEIDREMGKVKRNIAEKVRSGEVPKEIHGTRDDVKVDSRVDSVLDYVVGTTTLKYEGKLVYNKKTCTSYDMTWTLEDEVDANDFEQRRGNGSFRDWSNPLDDAIDAVEVAADLLMDKALHANYKISVSKNTNLVIEK